MKQVLIYSLLLVAGLVGSQLLPVVLGGAHSAPVGEILRLLTVLCLGFIMIHVGYEFEIDRSRLRSYGVDYGVAATAAGFPWIFCSMYFLVMFMPPQDWGSLDAWKQALLAGRFAAPTSAGVLFSMLAAAGLSATWVFRKARILAIFDDLDTILLMIPLKMLMVGMRWQLAVVALVMGGQLWVAWTWMRRVRLPVTWPWVLGYAAALTAATEAVTATSKLIDDVVPIHIEMLLPAFVLGCVLARPAGQDPHRDDSREGHQEGPESPQEQKVASSVSGLFMLLVGLSMPAIASGSSEAAGAGAGHGSWVTLAMHVIAVTVISNLGKMFPVFCYRKEAPLRHRLAVSIAMWPRGEVGAGILVISLSYGISGAMVTVATLSLALNLVATGLFILAVKALLKLPAPSGTPAGASR